MDRTVVVTGAFGALGSVVANAFYDLDDRVARVDVASTGLEADSRMLDIAGVDLSSKEACDRALADVAAGLGPVEVLVNIAGGFSWETLGDGDVETWKRLYSMNVLTAATMSKAALPALLRARAGRIINIGAGAAMQAAAGMGAYAAAKAGVHRLTESLAAELGDSQVTVNAVLPSIIDTPTNRRDMPDADTGNWVTPESIADVIVFLASEEARSVNGALIPVTRRG